MASINPYLTFDGNCEEAFNFYKSIFGGEFPYVGRFKDMPPSEGQAEMSPEFGNKIMHVCLAIGNTMLMGSDTSDEFYSDGKYTAGNNIAMSVNVDSREDADRIYDGLSNGGKKTMPMNDTFWGAYFGMLTDKFGIQWMVNYDDPAKMQK